MNYSVEWARSAAREVRNLPTSVANRVLSAVGQLASDPRPTGCKKLVGHKDLWRIRIGEYRVIYWVGDTIRLVRVERVSHRRDIYK